VGCHNRRKQIAFNQFAVRQEFPVHHGFPVSFNHRHFKVRVHRRISPSRKVFAGGDHFPFLKTFAGLYRVFRHFLRDVGIGAGVNFRILGIDVDIENRRMYPAKTCRF